MQGKIHRFQGFIISKANKDLTDREVAALSSAISMCLQGMTIRQAGAKYNVPKSTVHERIHTVLPNLCPDLYVKVVDQMYYNHRHPKKR